MLTSTSLNFRLYVLTVIIYHTDNPSNIRRVLIPMSSKRKRISIIKGSCTFLDQKYVSTGIVKMISTILRSFFCNIYVHNLRSIGTWAWEVLLWTIKTNYSVAKPPAEGGGLHMNKSRLTVTSNIFSSYLVNLHSLLDLFWTNPLETRVLILLVPIKSLSIPTGYLIIVVNSDIETIKNNITYWHYTSSNQ